MNDPAEGARRSKRSTSEDLKIQPKLLAGMMWAKYDANGLMLHRSDWRLVKIEGDHERNTIN